MKRLSHGAMLSEAGPEIALDSTPFNLVDSAVACPPPTNFGYLWPDLQSDPNNLLPPSPATVNALIELGNSMSDLESLNALDTHIPSAYGYFGQFLTHELILETTAAERRLGPDVVPLDASEIPRLKNARTPHLDLDSIYGPILTSNGQCYSVPMKGGEMELAYAGNSSVPGTDLPREPKTPFTARIGDRRNDANLITSQMHVAFLRAHNRLVAGGATFEQARKTLCQHFQWLVIADFLPRVVNESVRKLIHDGAIDDFIAPDGSAFMPVEFSAAAFRFGHSMPRSRYRYNDSYKNVRLSNLFLPKSGAYHHILAEWIIDWTNFIDGSTNLARRLDTGLVDPLARLIDEKGMPVFLIDKNGNVVVNAENKPVKATLGALDLLRGYLLRVPTGQAAAAALKLPELTAAQIEAAAAQVSDQQRKILNESGLSRRTPLWFYILAEAAHFENGYCLGPLGSSLIAQVLIGLIGRSTDSILRDTLWTGPTLGAGGQFDLASLFQFAGVLKLT